jgi:hypothetical protein
LAGFSEVARAKTVDELLADLEISLSGDGRAGWGHIGSIRPAAWPSLVRRSPNGQIRDAGKWAARARILLVDDEPAVTRGLSRLLATAGFDVSTASDGQDAIALIETPKSSKPTG